MSFGLEIFDELGNQRVKIEDRFTRVLGEVTTGYSSGSVTNSVFLDGTPFYAFVSVISIQGGAGYLEYPSVSIVGNTLSWSFSGSPTTVNVSVKLLYGVF